MIFEKIIPEENQARSRKYYNRFCRINGFSYSCLGETVIILLAVQLSSPDYVISTLGAMIYIGYVLLPMGRYVTSRVGAAESQAGFWVARNLSALLVAASVPVCFYVSRGLSMAMLLLGGFLFYGLRAAGVIMAGPLIGDITNEKNRPGYIANNSFWGYVTGVLALSMITLLLYFTGNNVWSLTGVIVLGACLGITASRNLHKVDETRALMESAKEPLLLQLHKIRAVPGIKRILFCSFLMNFAVIMLIPISLLALKRGCHVSDTGAILFSICQWIASSVLPIPVGWISRRSGPRKVMIVTYLILMLVPLFWIIAPYCFRNGEIPKFLLLLPFLIGGGCHVPLSNAMTNYYLGTIEPKLRVTYAICSSTLGGAVSGVIGMVVTGTILGVLEKNVVQVSVFSYGVYFIIAMVILLPGVMAFSSLTPLPIEKRGTHWGWCNFLW